MIRRRLRNDSVIKGLAWFLLIYTLSRTRRREAAAELRPVLPACDDPPSVSLLAVFWRKLDEGVFDGNLSRIRGTRGVFFRDVEHVHH